MKSCSDCAFYRANTCHAWLIPTKPKDEPCDKFRLGGRAKEYEPMAQNAEDEDETN